MKRKIATILFFIIDIGIIVFSFLFIAWLRAGTRIIIKDYARTLVAFGVIWLGVGFFGQKFRLKLTTNGMTFAKNMLKVDLAAVSLIFGIMLLFQKFHYSRYIVFSTIGMTIGLELLFFLGLYFALRFHRENESFASATLVTRSRELEEAFSDRFIRDANRMVPKLETGPYTPDFCADKGDSSLVELWKTHLADNPRLFDFINTYLDLTDFCQSKTMVMFSDDYYHITGVERGSQQLFVNQHKLNDFRRVNQYLIRVNENLMKGGVFVCCGETIAERRNRFFRKYTFYLGFPAYLVDFIFRRICPKIPIVQGWYFALTKGKNRALSETEMIGRFYFCGFELISKNEINGYMYFILNKIKPHSQDPNPSYGPLIKLKRVGQDGKTIYINKLRTMHPYSEYLQDYVYRTSDLQEGGKFKRDFRVTSWGRVFRNLWIDELPQLLNFFKGELSLVGVRALSEHYYSLYPPDLQELRCKFKPGLVPPFYADMPRTFDEIMASERRYLLQKQEQPFLTDCKYFWKAAWNILFRHARSN